MSKKKEWDIFEVKNHFEEIVNYSKNEGPQKISSQGEELAWIVSPKDYHQLRKNKESIVDFFQKSPHRDINLELDRSNDLPSIHP